MFRIKADAKACVDINLVIIDLKGRSSCLINNCSLLMVWGARRNGQEQNKLIIAQPAEGFIRLHMLGKSLAEHDQYLVACFMSQRFIHGFEIADINQHQAEFLFFSVRNLNLCINAVDKQGSIGQTGECVI